MAAALALLLQACLGTRLVNLDRLDVAVPKPQADWRSDIDALLARYERAPVLAPDDARLEPLFGGLTTLSYFGADAAPRVRDQQILPPGPARGETIKDVCGAAPQHTDVYATTGLPPFAPVWLPLAIHGGAAALSCNEHGAPSAPDGFCMFARLALQPNAHAPLIVAVHGLFDSGAQEYLQRMAAVLYGLGYSVIAPDMRDHGDTLRAAPQLATTLGTLEGADLMEVVRALRRDCGARLERVGIAGVSGGGLAAIRAFTADVQGELDAGVLALSPLLDSRAAIDDLSESGACPVTRAIELSWLDDALIGAAGGATFFAGATVSQALEGRALDGNTALAAGIGAGAGLLGALALDAFFDGGSEPCVSEHAIARIVQDIVRVRWRNLRSPALQGTVTMSPAGRRLAPEAVTLEAYVRERAEFLAAQSGIHLQLFDAATLAHALRGTRLRPEARLLAIGAEDDPMTRLPALKDFAHRTAGIPQAQVRVVRHGGHGAMWVVQPTIMAQVAARFFGATAPPAGALSEGGQSPR